MSETTESIAEWSRQTFGPVNLRAVWDRADMEMNELENAIDGVVDSDPADEAADVVIVLCRLTAEYGVDLWGAVERKMAVNRERQWSGWQHVKDSRRA